MQKHLFTILALLAVSSAYPQSETTDKNRDAYDRAKLFLANNKPEEAIPILTNLAEKDQNPNINYLLGVCYVKQDIKNGDAIKHLEKAEKKFKTIFNNPAEEAPEHVYYYMTIAYSRARQCEKAANALKEFEKVYFEEDEYYLVDGSDWVNKCYKKQEKQKTFKDRLTKATGKDVKTTRREYTTASQVYGVQVGAYLEPKFIREFEGLKNVEAYVDEYGVFRYVIGNLTMRSQAEKLLQKIRDAGYHDAFIVDINQDDEKYKSEVVTVDNESIKFEIHGKVEYRVQVGAFKELMPERLSELYLEVDDIIEVRQDSLTILTAGRYEDYQKASYYKDELVRSGTVPDAFVVAYNYHNKVSVKDANEYMERKQGDEENVLGKE